MDKTKVPVYARIDEDIRNLTSEYVHQSKLKHIDITNTRNKLIEEALREYVQNHPIQ